jgi:aminoglycoside 6'-N-acetyltransferase
VTGADDPGGASASRGGSEGDAPALHGESGDGVPTLRGERVVLRPLTVADAPALLAILRDPGVAAWWRRATWDQVNEEGATVFAVVVDGEIAGSVQFCEETDPDYRNAAIDIFVADAWQDRGVGSDAMRTLIRYLVEQRGHHRLTVDPAAANERAIHVYERLGFRRVGTMRAYERVADDTWRDALLMELIAGERG